jgi:hypothetical protein
MSETFFLKPSEDKKEKSGREGIEFDDYTPKMQLYLQVSKPYPSQAILYSNQTSDKLVLNEHR